ncbi:MAG: ankyrin repeat domain-containing protein [Luteimonas sp.]|nr:ankyrin repeat domain-containing protein [Luteimonas sp.]
MPESSRSRLPVVAALLLGLALSAVAGLGGVVAAVAGVLAQPALALAVRGGRGAWPASGERLWRDALALLALWSGAVAVSAALVAWPLAALRANGGLGSALALSAAIGIVVIGLWRTWPLWHAVEREGGSLRRHWHALADRDASSWRGFAAGACIACVVAPIVVLAWPGLLAGNARWGLAGILAFSSPILHFALQRLRMAEALPLPVVEMPGEPGVALEEEAQADLEVALYAAARLGRVDRALELIDAGADVFSPPPPDDRDQRSLPVLAAVLPDLRLLRILIGRGVDLNTPHAGMTPLLAATRDSWHGRPEAVMTLLANGADPRATDGEGNTPLHHAARSSDPGVAALLRDASAELDVANLDGVTPLGAACSVGNWRLARFLLERGAKAEVADALPALLAAAGADEDDPAGVQLLLKHKAKVDTRDVDGRSALHVAAASGHAEIVAALLDAGADVQARDIHGMSPLLAAARGGRVPAFDALVDAASDVSAKDGEGRSALIHAVQADVASLVLVQRIRELGVSAEIVDRAGKRAVDYAAEAGRWTLVAALDPDYVLPSSVRGEDGDAVTTDRPPLDLLREGLQEARYDGLERLAALLSPAELGGLLLEPDASPSADRIRWLLANGADAASAGDEGALPAFALLARGPEAVPALQALLDHGAPLDGEGGLARFLAACIGGDRAGRGLEQFSLDLLEHGADAKGVPEDGDPALSLAIHLGWSRLVDALIDRGVDLDARDARGMTALHLAAALGREPALKALVLRGASPDVRAADGQTPLGVALASGRRDLADWLDWRGWALPGRALQAEDVPAAAIAGDADAVRKLVDLGFAVDAPDAQGCTALLRACGGGHRAVVELLLERGADPQHVAHTGATPLSAAVSMRQGEIVERLLLAGAALEQRLPNDVTVLMLAAALGLPDLCARLLTAGANVHATDAQGLTPLHCAALYGFTARDRARLLALFDTLLLAGAETDAVAAGGVTPLLLLLGARAEPGTACDEDVVLAALDQLLDEGVSLEARDPRGFGPLHLAGLHGLLRTTQRLLRAGADPDLRDALNRTPREIAVMRGFIDVAAEYVPVPQGVSMARFLREPK